MKLSARLADRINAKTSQRHEIFVIKSETLPIIGSMLKKLDPSPRPYILPPHSTQNPPSNQSTLSQPQSRKSAPFRALRTLINSLKAKENKMKEKDPANAGNTLYALVVLISFILFIPWLRFAIRADWDQPNAQEILQEKFPERYEKYMLLEAEAEENGGYVPNWPTQDDFYTIWMDLSLICGFPFILSLLSLFMLGYGVIALVKALPLFIKMILGFIFGVVLVGIYSITLGHLVGLIKDKLARKT